jgi:ribosome-binding protein aMBF1 (putative translation factor)
VTITAEQVNKARWLVGWSERDLAARAGVSTSSVRSFEAGIRTPTEWCAATIRKALEAGGIKFDDDPAGVRLRNETGD